MVAVRPTFHNPALLAKQAANIDHIGGGGRLSLNVVSSWWADEATKYGVHFEQHDDRYARTSEWLDVVDGIWSRAASLDYAGQLLHASIRRVLQPKPASKPRPVIYAGGESEAAKDLIAKKCDAYVSCTATRRTSSAQDRRHAHAARLRPAADDLRVAGYAIVRDTDAAARREVARITDVKPARGRVHTTTSNGSPARSSNNVSPGRLLGLKPRSPRGLVGTPEQIAEQVMAFETAGIDLLLLQFSPQFEEMERFAEQVIPLVNGRLMLNA